MRYLHSSFRFLISGLVVSTVLMILSCQDQKISTIESNLTVDETNATFDYIISLGFDRKNIIDKGDYYIVEGDIRFNKQPVSNKGARPNHSIPNDQPVIPYNNVNSVYIGVQRRNQFGGGFPDDASFQRIVSGVQQAVNSWNNIGGSRLHLVYVNVPDYTYTAGGDGITVQFDGLDSGTYGLGSFPAFCRPGISITVAQQTIGLSDSQIHAVLVHEIGHNIGFRHTNEGSTLGFHIPDTPLTDSQSVMNSRNANPNPSIVPQWSGFAASDQLATSILYPTTTNANSYFNTNDNSVYVKWTISYVCNKTVRIETYKNGVFFGAQKLPNQGLFTFNGPNLFVEQGTYEFRIMDPNNTANYLSTTLYYYF